MDRRTTLMGGMLLTATAFLGSGCTAEQSKTSRTADSPSIAPVSLASLRPPEPTPTVSIQTQIPPTIASFDPLARFVPEMDRRSLVSQGDISLSPATLKWFNFSKLSFDQVAFQAAYGALLQLQSENSTLDLVPATPDRPPLRANINLSPEQQRYLVILPQGAPNQFLDKAEGGKTDGLTMVLLIPDQPPLTVSLVRDSQSFDPKGLTPFEIADRSTNKTMIVEACQSALLIRVQDPRFQRLLQETICNSFGLAGQLRLSRGWIDYGTFIKTASRAYSFDGQNLPPLILGENIFNKFPVKSVLA